MHRLRISIGILFAITVISAVPAADADALIRQANKAFADKDFDSAEKLYSQAEALTADPGLVAFNKGLVHFQKKQYREAELHFRRTLEDRQIPKLRQAKAWYNLGICLVHLSGETDSRQLRSAIACFENALAVGIEDDVLIPSAKYNLEAAKLLWVKANARKAQPDPANAEPPESKDKPKKAKEEDKEPPSNGSGKEKAPGKNSKFEPADKKGEQKPKEVDTVKKKPGAGTAPVLPDTAEVVPLPAADTRALLIKIEDRLRKERIGTLKEATRGDRIWDW